MSRFCFSPPLQFFNHHQKPSEYAYFFNTDADADAANSALNWSARDATSPSRDYPKPWLDYLFERCLMMFKLTNLHCTVRSIKFGMTDMIDGAFQFWTSVLSFYCTCAIGCCSDFFLRE